MILFLMLEALQCVHMSVSVVTGQENKTFCLEFWSVVAVLLQHQILLAIM